MLAIEPEPECYLETIDDVIRFFDGYLFDEGLVSEVTRAGGRPTQHELAALLDRLRRDPVCWYLEVETYTWDVLPPEYRTTDVCTAIARELAWVRDRLES